MQTNSTSTIHTDTAGSDIMANSHCSSTDLCVAINDDFLRIVYFCMVRCMFFRLQSVIVEGATTKLS